MKEISSQDDFRNAKFTRDAFIVITDTTGNTIHMPRCENVDIVSFREKVLDNGMQNGAYYLVYDLVDALEHFRAKKCQNCRPR